MGNQAAQYLHVKETLANLPGTPISQDVLDRLQASADRLSALQNAMNKLADDMEKNVADAGSNRQDVKNLVGQAQSAISNLKSDVDSTLRPQLEQLSGTINSATSSMENLRTQLSAASSSVNDGSNGVREGLSKLQSTFSGIGNQLREASQKIADIHNKLNGALESGDLAKVRTIIGSDPQALAVALAAPVGVTTIPVYPVDNFGSQMAPFYTALALWVGSVLMIITIRSDVTTENVVEGLDSSHPAVGYFKRHRLGLWEGFLGRYLIFGLIALTQATILSLGLLFFVKIQHVHPWLFMFTAWAIALVFSFSTPLSPLSVMPVKPWACCSWSCKSPVPAGPSPWQFFLTSSVRFLPIFLQPMELLPCGRRLPVIRAGSMWMRCFCLAYLCLLQRCLVLDCVLCLLRGLGSWLRSWSPRSSCRASLGPSLVFFAEARGR